MIEIVEHPGVVDLHVHLRTPGQEHKEDFSTGSRAALAGGNILMADMPNNTKLVKDLMLVREKIQLAQKDIVCDLGFYLGTLGEKDQNFLECMPHVLGLKIYMNITTGHFVVTDRSKLDLIFRRWESEKPVLVHAEGDRLPVAIQLAEKYDRTLYVCHTTGNQIDRIKRAKDRRPDKVFAEVTPHHLALDAMWAAAASKQMKPPLDVPSKRLRLIRALAEGDLDVVGTDHAPHTKEEKTSENPPSGVTGLETTLPILLMMERAGLISWKRIVEVTHSKPLSIHRLESDPTTLIEITRGVPWTIRGDAMQTKCHTTPFEGFEVLDKVSKVILRGKTAYKDGQVLAESGSAWIIPQAA